MLLSSLPDTSTNTKRPHDRAQGADGQGRRVDAGARVGAAPVRAYGMSEPADIDVTAWVNASHYDLQTARSLLRSRRYIYVLFMCQQQSVEKLLKAHVTRATGELAPRIHNLVRLAEMSGEEFTAEERVLLERLSLYYLQARDPPEIAVLAKTVKRAMAADHLQQTERLWKRLRRPLRRER